MTVALNDFIILSLTNPDHNLKARIQKTVKGYKQTIKEQDKDHKTCKLGEKAELANRLEKSDESES